MGIKLAFDLELEKAGLVESLRTRLWKGALVILRRQKRVGDSHPASGIDCRASRFFGHSEVYTLSLHFNYYRTISLCRFGLEPFELSTERKVHKERKELKEEGEEEEPMP